MRATETPRVIKFSGYIVPTARAVRCPYCGAAAGKACRVVHRPGRPATLDIHVDRQRRLDRILSRAIKAPARDSREGK